MGAGKGSTDNSESIGYCGEVCCECGLECCDGYCDCDEVPSSSGDCGSDCGECAGGCAEGCGDCLGSCDSFVDTRSFLGLRRLALTLQIFFLGIVSSFAQSAQNTSKSLQFALFAGPEISIGPIFLTGGVCFGQFGCLAIGGGVHHKGFGGGILIPIWPLW